MIGTSWQQQQASADKYDKQETDGKHERRIGLAAQQIGNTPREGEQCQQHTHPYTIATTIHQQPELSDGSVVRLVEDNGHQRQQVHHHQYPRHDVHLLPDIPKTQQQMRDDINQEHYPDAMIHPPQHLHIVVGNHETMLIYKRHYQQQRRRHCQ